MAIGNAIGVPFIRQRIGKFNFPLIKEKALQWLFNYKGIARNARNGNWEVIDGIGKRDGEIQEGRCFNFDGVDDFIETSYKLPNSAFKITVKVDTNNNGRYIYSDWGVSSKGLILQRNAADALQIIVNATTLNVPDYFNEGKGFRDIIVEYDGNGGWILSDNIEGQLGILSSVIPDFDNGTTFIIGNRIDGTRAFEGLIGDVNIYDSQNRLLHSWHCDDAEGSDSRDAVIKWYGDDIISPLDFTNWASTAGVSNVTEDSFTTSGIGGKYKQLMTIGHKYRLITEGVTNGCDVYERTAGGVLNKLLDGVNGEFEFIATQEYLYYRNTIAGETTITKAILQKVESEPVDGTIQNADLNTFHAIDNNFRSYQNEFGYSEKENYTRYSEDFDNGTWNKINISLSGDKIIENNSNAVHSLSRNYPLSSTKVIISIEAKAEENRYLQITSYGDSLQYVNFDLLDGVIGDVGPTTGIRGIIPLSDGWYRCFAEVITSSGGQAPFVMINSLNAPWNQSYQGDGVSGLRIRKAWSRLNESSEYAKTENFTVEAALQPIALNSDGTPTGLDIFNNVPTYNGLVRRNAKLVNNNVGVFDGVDDSVLVNATLVNGWSALHKVYWDGLTDFNVLFSYAGGSEIVVFRISTSKVIQLFDGASSVSGSEILSEGYYTFNYGVSSSGTAFLKVYDIDSIEGANAVGSIVNFQLGNQFSTNRAWSGNMQTVAFFNREVTSEELENFALNDILPTDQIHQYDFTTGSGDLVEDRVPDNPANGTIQNANLQTFWGKDNFAKPTNAIEGFSNGLYCSSSGTSYKESTQAYGVWDFIVNISSRENTTEQYIISATSSISNSYRVNVNNVNTFTLRRDGALLFTTVIDYLNSNQPYRIIIFRNSVIDEYVTGGIGTFAVYIQGREGYPITDTIYTEVVESEMELVDTTGGSGTNPVTDNTYTTSNYIVNDLDAGDKISNLWLNGKPQNLHTFVDGTGTYNPLFIPSQTGNTGKDVNGAKLTNPSGKFHNGAETEIEQYKNPEMIQNDSDMDYWYDATGEPKQIDYADIVANVFTNDERNKVFADVSKDRLQEAFEKFNILTYDGTLTDEEINKIYKFLKIDIWLDSDTWDDTDTWYD